MSSTRTIGCITVAIGTGITAAAISLTAPDIASVGPPLCQDDIDCRLQEPTTTSLSPPVKTFWTPLPTATIWTPPPPPPTTTWPPTPPPTTPSIPSPADPGSEPTPTCPRYARDCAPQ